MVAALKPAAAPEALSDQLFAAYAAQVTSVLKKQVADQANQAKDELASSSSAAASLRVLAAFLDKLAEEHVHRLWFLTASVFAVRASPSGQATPGYGSLLSASYGPVSKGALASLGQAVGDAVSSPVMNLLRAMTGKSTRTPLEALQHPFDVLKRLMAFYGDPHGPLYLTVAQLQRERDLEQVAADVVSGLEEHQPLREAVGAVLKAIKLALEGDHATIDAFAAHQVWTEGKEATHMVKGMLDLLDTCALVAALSRHTALRTNSEALLSQFLTAVLQAGQQTKSAATKVALGKLQQQLQRQDDPGAFAAGVASPNFVPALAKTLYHRHMPSVLPALLSAASSSSSSSSSSSRGATKAKAERAMLV